MVGSHIKYRVGIICLFGEHASLTVEACCHRGWYALGVARVCSARMLVMQNLDSLIHTGKLEMSEKY